MGLKNRLRRLQKRAEGPIVTIPQPDGTVRRFPQSQLADAFLDAVGRSVGRKGLRHEPDGAGEHPLSMAARTSSDPKWRESFLWSERPEEEVLDLSEPEV